MALDPVTAGLEAVGTLIDRLVPDKDARERRDAAQAILKIQQEHSRLVQQMEVNEVEAAHPNVFVAGWRPAIGWVGVACLVYASVIHDLLVGFGVDLPPPTFIDENMIEIIGAMLGIGGFRSWEKSKGVARENFKRSPRPQFSGGTVSFSRE
ncbi:MAG: hypothetical protein GVY22_09245 [Gammaproteobacteria bacterium]|jgi:hypothetical protein|nr:hypothetical protein [Gammaproteobacteria bacterium]